MSLSASDRSVSVVIPAFNRADTLRDAIASVRAQSVTASEIIVVNDASTDGTAAILAGDGGSDLVVVDFPSNRGGAAARNAGIDAAKGAYIAFLDADDVWLPGKLERQLEAIDREGPSPRRFVFSRLIQTNEFGEEHVLPKRAPGPGEPFLDYIFVDDNVVQTSTLLVPAQLAKSVRFTDDLRRHQDFDFVIRLLAAGAEPLLVDEPLVHWRTPPQRSPGEPVVER